MVPGEGQSFHECVVRVSLVAEELIEPIKTFPCCATDYKYKVRQIIVKYHWLQWAKLLECVLEKGFRHFKNEQPDLLLLFHLFSGLSAFPFRLKTHLNLLRHILFLLQGFLGAGRKALRRRMFATQKPVCWTPMHRSIAVQNLAYGHTLLILSLSTGSHKVHKSVKRRVVSWANLILVLSPHSPVCSSALLRVG